MGDGHEASRIPFRVRIGVTGHRRLTEPEAVSRRITEALGVQIPALLDQTSRGRVSRSTRTPLVYSVLTPLAEGADRLAAQVVLMRPDARIDVVLPLTLDDYLEDFETDASRAEFRRLFGLARRPIALRNVSLASYHTPAEAAAERKQAYEDVGRYVVTHCDVLLAVWDGEESSGKGGTADVVAYARTIGRPVVVIPAGESGEIEVFPGEGISAESFFRIDAFNSHELGETTAALYVENVYAGLFDNAYGMGLRADLKAAVRTYLLPYYARASVLAKKRQRLYLVAGSLAYSFAVLALAAVAVSALFWEGSPVVFGVEFVILAASLVTVLVANYRRTQRGWIENRFLAERLRVAMFLTACGVEASSAAVPPVGVAKPRPGGWTEAVFEEILNRLPVLAPCSGGTCAVEIAFVREVWIGGQIEFHAAKAKKNSRLSRGMEVAGMVVFAVALAAPLFHLLLFAPLNLAGGASGSGRHDTARGLLTFCALVLPAVGAALGGIRSHREYSRLATRSEDMMASLEQLRDGFERVRNRKQFEAAVRQTESLMLLETQDWLSLTTATTLEYVA